MVLLPVRAISGAFDVDGGGRLVRRTRRLPCSPLRLGKYPLMKPGQPSGQSIAIYPRGSWVFLSPLEPDLSTIAAPTRAEISNTKRRTSLPVGEPVTRCNPRHAAKGTITTMMTTPNFLRPLCSSLGTKADGYTTTASSRSSLLMLLVERITRRRTVPPMKHPNQMRNRAKGRSNPSKTKNINVGVALATMPITSAPSNGFPAMTSRCKRLGESLAGPNFTASPSGRNYA